MDDQQVRNSIKGTVKVISTTPKFKSKGTVVSWAYPSLNRGEGHL